MIKKTLDKPKAQVIKTKKLRQSIKSNNKDNKVACVQLNVSGKNLADLDLFSESDPYCKLKMKTGKFGIFEEVGRTEVIDNNLSPKWVTQFKVNYVFERKQLLLFEVYDFDSANDHEFIGSTEIFLSDIMTSESLTCLGTLIHKSTHRGIL